MSEWEWGRVVRITLFNSRESRGARLSPLQAACLLHLKKCSSARQHRHPPTFLQHLPHLAFSSSPDGVSNTWPTPPPYPTDFFSVWCNTHSGASGGPPTITRFFSLFPTNTWPPGPSPASFWRARLCANTCLHSGANSGKKPRKSWRCSNNSSRVRSRDHRGGRAACCL